MGETNAKVELSKLSNQINYLRAITRNHNIKFSHPEATQSSRQLIPSLNQTCSGHPTTAGQSLPNFPLVDQSGYCPSLQRKNLEKLADEIHRDIKNVMHTGDTNSEMFHHGLVEYKAEGSSQVLQPSIYDQQSHSRDTKDHAGGGYHERSIIDYTQKRS